ncbi:MAG: hypothetical protein AAFW46_13730, partial [Pseudomonadota bacterium]
EERVTQSKLETSIVSIDYERYQQYLDNADLSEQEAREFIEALWSIVVAFVDLGFEVHSAEAGCGKLSKKCSNAAPEAPNALYCENNRTREERADFESESALEGAEE